VGNVLLRVSESFSNDLANLGHLHVLEHSIWHIDLLGSCGLLGSGGGGLMDGDILGDFDGTSFKGLFDVSKDDSAVGSCSVDSGKVNTLFLSNSRCDRAHELSITRMSFRHRSGGN
jgi:hypothetical protein